VPGPQGAQGAQGATGPPGPPGVTAAASASVDPPNVPLTTVPQTLVSTTITTTQPSRILVSASVSLDAPTPSSPDFISYDFACQARLTPAGGPALPISRVADASLYAFTVAASVQIPLTGASGVVPAGTHTVDVQCAEADADDIGEFDSGDLVVWAAGV
jgi:hypothetical protein